MFKPVDSGLGLVAFGGYNSRVVFLQDQEDFMRHGKTGDQKIRKVPRSSI